jgi:S-adenosylmethionine synthetase
MKILITGAGGLLGSEISFLAGQISSMKRKSDLRISQIIRVSSREIPGFLNADITTEEGINKIRGTEWDILIHSAAWRSPDLCQKDKSGAHRLNAWATEQLASEVSRRNATMLYISTDYVFPGTNPPYRENDIPNPINYYGETKLLGEKVVLSLCRNALALRVPLLYGMAAGLRKSDLLYGTLKALDSDKPWPMEDSIVRYPTYTGDVAEAVFLLLEKKASGIFHFSGQSKTTRYKMASSFAEIFGKSMKNIVRLEKAPETEAIRPHDSHLSMEKVLSLGIPAPTPFEERVRSMKNEILKEL